MIDPAKQQRLNENWLTVVDEVTDAAVQSGRQRDAVTIVGVTKYVGTELTAALVESGCLNLGENRPQVLWGKSEEHSFDEAVRWHVIGHLQRNKVRRTLRLKPVIHSVDSLRLLRAIAGEATEQQQTTDVLIEVNISDEAAKTGLSRSDLQLLFDSIPERGVRVVGLMAMAAFSSDHGEARKQFAAVRELRDQLQQTTGRALPELSMGMSGDFVEAIAEGATIVRIGSRIYEGVRE